MDVHNGPQRWPVEGQIDRLRVGGGCACAVVSRSWPRLNVPSQSVHADTRPSGGTWVPQRHLHRTGLIRLIAIGTCVVAVLLTAAASCTGPRQDPVSPDLAPRGTTLTTAKATRQDLTSRRG
jgi:hypothetical protein